MNLEVEAFEGELRELRKMRALVKHTFLAEKFGDIYFICGEGGLKDDNGLPERIYVCPSYGCDWFQIYTKTGDIHGPEY